MRKLSPESIHALHMAMQNELDTIQIYEHILKHVNDSQARKLLHQLIVDEHSHEHKIKEQIISGGGNVSKPEFDKDSDYPDRTQLLDIELDNYTITELVDLAIKNEQISRDFYRIQHKRMINGDIKAVFKWLVEQEEIHIQNLIEQYSRYLS